MSQLHDLWCGAFSCSLLRPCGYTCKKTHTHKERAIEAATPVHSEWTDLMITYLLLKIIKSMLQSFPYTKCIPYISNYTNAFESTERQSDTVSTFLHLFCKTTLTASREETSCAKSKESGSFSFFLPRCFQNVFNYLSALIVSAKAKPQIHFISI